MRFASVLLALALMAQISRAEDYYLSEEEDQETKEKEADPDDFMKRFACMVTTYRFVNKNGGAIDKYAEKEAYQSNVKRLKGGLFANCLEILPSEILEQFKSAKTSKDVEAIDLSFGHPTNLDDYFKSKDAKLSEEEKTNINNLNKIDRELKEMQRKSRRESPQPDEDDEETWENVRKSKEGPSLAGVSLNNKAVVISVLVGFLLLGLTLYKMSSSLFEEKKKTKKSNKKQA